LSRRSIILLHKIFAFILGVELEGSGSKKSRKGRNHSGSSASFLTKKDSQFQEDRRNRKFSRSISRKSISSEDTKKAGSSSFAEEEEKEDLPEVSFWRILALNKPEWCYIAGMNRVLRVCQI